MIVTFIENLIVNSINFLFNFFTENFLQEYFSTIHCLRVIFDREEQCF